MRTLDRERRGQKGYILLTLMLTVALLAVVAAVAAPDIAFTIKRNREEELIHRGVQYSRAIRRFAKKTGHYPVTLEQLQGDTYNRYLRKPYKDPVTGRDFRLLHMGDIYTSSSTPKLNASSDSVEGPDGSTAQDSTSATASTSDTATASASTATTVLPPSPQTALQAAGPMSRNSNDTEGQVIFGVASASKKPTIREFFHKNHYNDWLFFYDPNSDRGAEIKGPTSLVPVASQALGAALPSQRQTQNQQPPPPNTPQVSQPPQ